MIERIRPTEWPGANERKFGPGRAGSQRVGRIQQPRQRRHQAFHRISVEVVFPTEGEQHLRHCPALHRIPLVVRQMQIPDHARLVVPLGRLHINNSRRYDKPAEQRTEIRKSRL